MDVRAFLTGRSRITCSHKIRRVDELPMTPNGKLDVPPLCGAIGRDLLSEDCDERRAKLSGRALRRRSAPSAAFVARSRSSIGRP